MNKIYQKNIFRIKSFRKADFGGFTLIELLVVVLIIGILAAIALPQYTKAVTKSRAAEAVVTMRSLSAAVEEYMMANGTFPTSFDQLSVVPNNISASSSVWFSTKYFRYTLYISRERLQADNLTQDWGIIFYPYSQEIGVPGKKLYCSTNQGYTKGKELCKFLAGHDNKIVSPTNSAYYWWYLD